MKFFGIFIPVILVLLAGCTTLSLRMKVDPSLEANAVVYDVISPDSWTDKRLNVSFGAYRVADANSGWGTSDASPADEAFVGLGGYEVTIIETSRSISYKFKIGDEITWDSQCVHNAEKRIVESEKSSNLEILSSQFTCRYTRGGDDSWTLSIDLQGLGQEEIRLTGKDGSFTADSTAGVYVSSGDRPYKTFATSRDAGYTWTHDNKNVAAISVSEKTPRVWLEKNNPDSLNDLLSMASTGLLIYHWEIEPSLSQR